MSGISTFFKQLFQNRPPAQREDWISYLKDEMGNADSKAFEKQVEADPLSSEAMEGYLTSNISGQKADEILSDISNAIQAKRKKRVFSFGRNTQLGLATAASIALFAVVSVWFSSSLEQVADEAPSSTESEKRNTDTNSSPLADKKEGPKPEPNEDLDQVFSRDDQEEFKSNTELGTPDDSFDSVPQQIVARMADRESISDEIAKAEEVDDESVEEEDALAEIKIDDDYKEEIPATPPSSSAGQKPSKSGDETKMDRQKYLKETAPADNDEEQSASAVEVEKALKKAVIQKKARAAQKGKRKAKQANKSSAKDQRDSPAPLPNISSSSELDSLLSKLKSGNRDDTTYLQIAIIYTDQGKSKEAIDILNDMKKAKIDTDFPFAQAIKALKKNQMEEARRVISKHLK